MFSFKTFSLRINFLGILENCQVENRVNNICVFFLLPQSIEKSPDSRLLIKTDFFSACGLFRIF
jgi:hypothetical protein